MNSEIGKIMRDLNKREWRTDKVYDYPLDLECNVLANGVDYCFKNNIVGTLKDPKKVVKMLKRGNNKSGAMTGEFGSTMLSLKQDPFSLRVRYSENWKQDNSKFVITEVEMSPTGNVCGECKLLEMVKKVDEFVELELAKCKIEDVKSTKVEELNPLEKELYQRMQICSKLFSPVLNIRKKEVEIERRRTMEALELKAMLDDIKNESEKIAESKSRR